MSDVPMHETTPVQRALPIGTVAYHASGWYGMLGVIVTEGALFGYLLFSYFYCAVQLPPSWTPEPHPSLTYALPATLVMFLSSTAMWWAQRGFYLGAAPRYRFGLVAAILLGLVFVALELLEWKSKPFALTDSLYSSLYFTTTGIDLVHLIVGIIAVAAVLAWSLLGYVDARRDTPTLIVGAYWHFVTLAWLAVFVTFYISPYLR
ncbi:MAG: cytochrome c oxidase subunit 3 [Methylovirgula sp.]|uniref:cytochrome c oxidase subunit 3 n=1 Tax=Methylovirgula sp. TaxID=1978224 RepID=UPI00307605C6